MDFNDNNYNRWLLKRFTTTLLCDLNSLSSFIPIIPLAHMEFYVNNYKLSCYKGLLYLCCINIIR